MTREFPRKYIGWFPNDLANNISGYLIIKIVFVSRMTIGSFPERYYYIQLYTIIYIQRYIQNSLYKEVIGSNEGSTFGKVLWRGYHFTRFPNLQDNI